MRGGIWSAVLTPIGVDLAPDASTALPYYHELLEHGSDGINLLGTTGEAMSFSTDQRMKFMESLTSGGLPMERMMVGTGAASLDAAARLTRCAVDCGFVAALIMPPFFFRDALDDGIVHFFDALFSQVNPPPQGVLLYNFPRMSGITFHALLVDRLLREFPGIIAGMKDSSNDAALQTEVLSRHPKLSVFPGFEGDLLAAKARGAVGCISGSVSLWPRLARAAFIDEDETKAETLTKARNALDGVPFVPAMRYLTANLRRDPTWLRGMPPLMPVSDSQQRALDLAIEPFRGILG